MTRYVATAGQRKGRVIELWTRDIWTRGLSTPNTQAVNHARRAVFCFVLGVVIIFTLFLKIVTLFALFLNLFHRVFMMSYLVDTKCETQGYVGVA